MLFLMYNIAWVRAIQQSIYPETEESTPTTPLSPGYEDFCHSRTTNRLQWSLLLDGLNVCCVLFWKRNEIRESCDASIQAFRQKLVQLENTNQWSEILVKQSLSDIFENSTNSVGKLFIEFRKLFLEPFVKLGLRLFFIQTKKRKKENKRNGDNVELFEEDSVESVITLCTQDLKSFLKFANQLLTQKLCPHSFQSKESARKKQKRTNEMEESENTVETEAQKLEHRHKQMVVRLIKQYVHKFVFCEEIYDILFPLYQQAHKKDDKELEKLMNRYENCKTKDYDIAISLQVDEDECPPLPSFQQYTRTWREQKQMNNASQFSTCPSIVNESEVNSPVRYSESTPIHDHQGRLKASDDIDSTLPNHLTIVINGGDTSVTADDYHSSVSDGKTSFCSPLLSVDENNSLKNKHFSCFDKIERPPVLPVLQPCFDQFLSLLRDVSQCRNPLEKIAILVKLKEVLVQCIDEYRQSKQPLPDQLNDTNFHPPKDNESKEMSDSDHNGNGYDNEAIDYNGTKTIDPFLVETITESIDKNGLYISIIKDNWNEKAKQIITPMSNRKELLMYVNLYYLVHVKKKMTKKFVRFLYEFK
ncbi:hypothetical protein RFI_12714 [Reticulomyxa filosa]|uniref:Uncharacterized protein n=1 Tax=Reticulomyxa filosa TaxID=46433 RepID=X6NEX3_RETFI|nr:hypothetical protein RFI_12714 [Reticulomyxa filosa]|eukprot:ETO24443.1 hypothetical protein RFI_12714 [Reticulomyxa filosa]